MPSEGQPHRRGVDSLRGRLARRVQDAAAGGPWRYLVGATALCFAVKLPTSLLARAIFTDRDGSLVRLLVDEGRLTAAALGYIVLLAPGWETAVAQVVPITAVRRGGGGTGVALVASAAVFVALHALDGAAEMLTLTPVGIVLAGTYMLWEERGWPTAFALTAGVLVMHNAVAVFLPLTLLRAGIFS